MRSVVRACCTALRVARRTSRVPNAGNFYRELSRLQEQGLVTLDKAASADMRRASYRITERGSEVFDHWIQDPNTPMRELPNWVLFLGLLEPAVATQLIERVRRKVRLEVERLAAAHDDARSIADQPFHAKSLLLFRQLKHSESELAFVEKLAEKSAARLDDREARKPRRSRRLTRKP